LVVIDFDIQHIASLSESPWCSMKTLEGGNLIGIISGITVQRNVLFYKKQNLIIYHIGHIRGFHIAHIEPRVRLDDTTPMCSM
jgi:hypothetical protein